MIIIRNAFYRLRDIGLKGIFWNRTEAGLVQSQIYALTAALTVLKRPPGQFKYPFPDVMV